MSAFCLIMNCFNNEAKCTVHMLYWWHCLAGTAKKQSKGKEEFVKKGKTTSYEHKLMNKVHKFFYCTAIARNMFQKKAS